MIVTILIYQIALFRLKVLPYKTDKTIGTGDVVMPSPNEMVDLKDSGDL